MIVQSLNTLPTQNYYLQYCFKVANQCDQKGVMLNYAQILTTWQNEKG